jgi:predicted enzyme related to lactoylglutathione lyase
MGDRTSYAPGTLSWTELVTTDADAAKAFYTELFGWSYDDRPVGPDMVYSMAQVAGRSVAALYKADERPHWNSYVTVESCDAAAAKAAELGGTVTAEPFDVMTAGRSAAIVDPTGAQFFLWEPGDNIGAYLVNGPGLMSWNDLVTPDPEAAEAFYGGLFGWTFEEIPEAHGYRIIRNGDATAGGLLPSEHMPAQWLPYFGHADVDAVIAGADEQGAKVLFGPIPVPSGQFAVLADPQGAPVGLLSSNAYDD